MNPSPTRRAFLKQAAALSPFFIVPRHVLGKGFLAPSDRVGLGFIGLGRQSQGLLRNFIKTDQTEIRAISDVDKTKVDRTLQTVAKATSDLLGKAPASAPAPYENYLDLLARRDVDAVVIATPDHWHAVQGVKALEAGKDVYCEKPLTLTVAEGRALVNATRKNNRVLQTGSMQRSDEKFRRACELVRNGYLGQLKEVLVTVGGPPVPVDFTAETLREGLNWDLWLGPNPPHFYHHFLAPRIEDTFWGRWRDYKGFGGGGVTDWGAHMFDIAQWALGMDESGPTEFFPPTFPQATHGMVMKYANGVVVKHQDFGRGNAVRFIGSDGTLDVSRSFLDVPEKLKTLDLKESDVKLTQPAGGNHYADFLNSIRTRQKPLCDVETGHRTCTVCNVTNIGYQLRRPLRWNPATEKFDGDKEANALLTRTLRAPHRIAV